MTSVTGATALGDRLQNDDIGLDRRLELLHGPLVFGGHLLHFLGLALERGLAIEATFAALGLVDTAVAGLGIALAVFAACFAAPASAEKGD